MRWQGLHKISPASTAQKIFLLDQKQTHFIDRPVPAMITIV